MNIERIEWMDITETPKGNPFEDDTFCLVFVHFGVVVKQFKQSGCKVIRIAHRLGNNKQSMHECEYHDIPVGCIISRKILAKERLDGNL